MILTGYADEVQDTPALHQLFYYTALCWVSPRGARKTIPDIQRLQKRAKTGGYDWVGAECITLLRRLRHGKKKRDRQSDIHERMGVLPMLDTIREQAPWERGLTALEGLSDRASATPKTKGPTSRLTWRISVNKWGVYLEP